MGKYSDLDLRFGRFVTHGSETPRKPYDNLFDNVTEDYTKGAVSKFWDCAFFVDYLIARIYPGTEAMQWIHYAGIIIFGGYLILCLIYNRPRREDVSGKRKNRRTRNRHHIDINNRPD